MADLDAELRRLAWALVDEAPAAPGYEEFSLAVLAPVSRAPRRTRTLVAAAIVVGVVAVAVVVALTIGNRTATRQQPLAPQKFIPCQSPNRGAFMGPDGKAFGPVPNAHPEGGTLTAEDVAAMPDYVSVTCRDGTGIGGYVKKTDMFGAGPRPILNGGLLTVYADDGTTVVGHFGGGNGFVALNEDPRSVPNARTSTSIYNQPRAS